MASPADLTTLVAVKRWMPMDNASSDGALSSLISAASRAMCAYMSRPSLAPTFWVDRYDDRLNLRRVVLRNWPVVSVAAVSVGALTLAAVDPSHPSVGYALDSDPWGGLPPGSTRAIDFFCGAAGCGGRQAISVSYIAGYQGSSSDVVPASGGVVFANPFYGAWQSDQGVTYSATGAALTAVALGTTLAKGQYSVTQAADGLTGQYTFAAADAGAPITMSYGYIPSDIGQACVELVAQRFTAASRIGVKSKSLGGQETVSFDLSGLPDAVKSALAPYRKVNLL